MSSVRLALVIGAGDKDENLEVVDLTKIQPLTPTIFLIETKPVQKLSLIKNGAGDEIFTHQQIKTLLSTLHP